MLRIFLLGPFRVEQDGREIPRQAWARPKDRSVLKLLALDGGRLVPQDRLLDALWPNLAPASAANSLHASVSRLRKLLGPAAIIREAAGYSLAAPSVSWVDVEEFRRLLGQGREWRRRGARAPAVQPYRAAVALYSGDLCEDDPYEEWALRPREQLREAYLALLEELADCLSYVGAPVEVVELCERGLAKDQTREGLYVQLMHFYAAAGRVAEALQVYERCRRALADELGVDPGPAVRAIRAQLLSSGGLETTHPSRDLRTLASAAPVKHRRSAGRPALDGMGRLHLPCVGRERELAYLEACLDVAQAGNGQLVLVHGEPGIGKSRLLEELGLLAESRGVRQLTARCYEMERDLPYAPIVDALSGFLLERVDPAQVGAALGQWGPQLAGLIPLLRDLVPKLPQHLPSRPDAERAALLAGLTHLLIGLSRSTPLALLLDDLQWADHSTVQWLHYLARRLSAAPLLVVGTFRSSEADPDHPLQRLQESLADDPAAPQLLELPCLKLEHVAALLPTISGSASRGHAVAVRLHGETDGHPLFLIETLRTLLETGRLRLDEQGSWAESAETSVRFERRLPLPANVREAIRWRVRRLSERERRVLAAAAVVGRGFDPELLARMTGIALDIVIETLETLIGRQLVRLSLAGSGFAFRHDLIQAVVYADLSPDRRRAFHARAAEALEDLATGRQQRLREAAGALSYHWWRAEQWASAFHYALLAGDYARAAFAPREALTHYQRAAELADQHSELLEPRERLALGERLGRTYADLGELDEAVRQFARSRNLARAVGDRLQEGHLLAALADAHYWRHDFGQAEALAAKAVALSEELGDQSLVAATRVSIANIAIAQGHTDEAERHCDAVLTLTEARATADGNAEPALASARLNALGWLGVLHQWRGDHQQAAAAIDASLRLGQELHNPFLTGRSRFALGMSLGNCGRYEEALGVLREALRLAEEAGDRYWLPRLPNTIGWVYSELGDLRQAADWNRRSIALAGETRWLEAEANARVNLAADALRQGNLSAAREELAQATTLIERDNWFTWRYRMRLLLELGELALLEGAPARAQSFASQALAVAESTRSRKHAGRAWLLRGRAMLAAGAPPEKVLAALQQAQLLAHVSGYPPLLWTSARELAALHARLGHEEEAAACRGEARATIEAVTGGLRDPALRQVFLNTETTQRMLGDP